MNGFVVFPRLGIHANIQFLLDTGAESTCIHPSDSLNLKMPFGELLSQSIAYGIGGSSLYYEEPAVLSWTTW